MADYSRYGIPSSQWAECIQDNSNDVFLRGFVPDIASRPIKYIEELQHVANRNQIAAAHEHCDRMGIDLSPMRVTSYPATLTVTELIRLDRDH
jgi:hypothetical protein